jgi:hypothetical protein
MSTVNEMASEQVLIATSQISTSEGYSLTDNQIPSHRAMEECDMPLLLMIISESKAHPIITCHEGTGGERAA